MDELKSQLQTSSSQLRNQMMRTQPLPSRHEEGSGDFVRDQVRTPEYAGGEPSPMAAVMNAAPFPEDSEMQSARIASGWSRGTPREGSQHSTSRSCDVNRSQAGGMAGDLFTGANTGAPPRPRGPPAGTPPWSRQNADSAGGSGKRRASSGFEYWEAASGAAGGHTPSGGGDQSPRGGGIVVTPGSGGEQTPREGVLTPRSGSGHSGEYPAADSSRKLLAGSERGG